MPVTASLTKYAKYVTDAVCARRSVPVESVVGTCRTRQASWARFEIWAILVRGDGQPLFGPYSAGGVARMFGRDHSSILHGVKRWTGAPLIPSKRVRRASCLQDPSPPPIGCYLPPTPCSAVPKPTVTTTPEKLNARRPRK